MSLQLVQGHSASPYSVECGTVASEEIGQIWEMASAFVGPALDLTRKLDLEDALALCMEGDAQLWIIWSDDFNNVDLSVGRYLGAAVTELQVHRNGYKILTFLGFGGNFIMEWVHDYVTIVEDFARKEGCHAVEMKGRKGWGKVFQDYKQTSWTYTKELTP